MSTVHAGLPNTRSLDNHIYINVNCRLMHTKSHLVVLVLFPHAMRSRRCNAYGRLKSPARKRMSETYIDTGEKGFKESPIS